MRELPSVIIIEDELITAESIKELLEGEDFTVAGIAKDAGEAEALCQSMTQVPQVALCDINIRGRMNGVQLAAQLKDAYGCEIIFLTAYTDQQTLRQAFAMEPVMYLVKPYNDTQLLVAVQMAFHKYLSRHQEKVNTTLDLTDREKEIASLVAQGHSSKQIASKLYISIETVKTHRRRMLQKNNISSFPQLVYLMNNGHR